MESTKKNLKIMSILVLILALFSLVRVAVEIFTADYSSVDATKEMIMVAQIVTAVLSIIILIPQIYVGVKGFKVAKNPDSSRGHIVWATILLVLSLIAIIITVVQGIQDKNFKDKFASLGDAFVDIAILSSYISFAKQLKVNA